MKKTLPKRTSLLKKLLILIFITVFLISLVVLFTVFIDRSSDDVKYGVTFSPPYAQFLGLDWEKTYIEVLDDLKVKHLRIPTYWDRVEKIQGEYDFSEVDFMLDEAKKRGGRVILVLGAKQPRWPECHYPKWVTNYPLHLRQQEVLNYLQKTIEKYRDHSSVISYQVENEPLFEFGIDCDPPDKEFLTEEVDLVRSLDPKKPIILTDTGEWSNWIDIMRLSDIMGISIYRFAYFPNIGYYNYPFTPGFYILKSYLVRTFFASQNQKTIVAEAQAEPWFADDPMGLTPSEHQKLFTEAKFKENIEFNQKLGFEELHFWGVEWWYYMKLHGYPGYWDQAKELFN